MQVTRVSFMNFNGGKKVAPKDLKKAQNLIKEEKKPQTFFSDTALTGEMNNAADDTYLKQYAQNREDMKVWHREPEINIADSYFGPFQPIKSIK